MLDTSAYNGQTIPPQFLLQALLGQSHGQHFQGFGGPQSLFGHQTLPYGQQPIWPTIGGQGPFGGFAPPSGPFGGLLPPALIAQLGQLAALAPYLQAQQQLGQQGFHGGWPGQQLPFGIGQLGGFAPQLGAWGQQHQLGAFGRGILPYQGVPPQMAFTGC